MSSKFFQRLKHQACVALFGIVLISACTVSAGAVFTEGSGEGMVLYGDTILPDFSDYISTQFPYAAITNLANQQWGAMVFSEVPYVYNDYLTVAPVSSYAVYSLVDGAWVFEGIHSVSGPTVIAPVSYLFHVWVNFDVLNHNDSSRPVVFSSSDPFPLDGYNYIEWDGDTTDLPQFTEVPFGNYFYYGPVSFDSNAFVNSYELLVRNSDSSFLSFGTVAPVDNRVSYILSYGSGSAFVPQSLSRAIATSDSGLYLSRTATGHYTKYFIYSLSTDAYIDFSSTTITASNPQYDYQSAAFDVSWSNLPVVPYPDNVQYFIQGRLNDGSISQPPEIYLGSSSDPPSSLSPVSFSFTNLQPETQYTATFELVYNNTGSFRDFIGSGVTTTVSFTTLSDGSISEGDKAIINAIQQGNKDNQQWTDSQFGSAVGDLPQDTSETDNLISGLDQQEEAYKDDAYDRFQELSSAFSGFDGSVGSGIGLAGTLFSRFFNALGSYKIIYTFPLLLGLAMVLIGRLGRSSIRMEREPGDQFKIDGW